MQIIKRVYRSCKTCPIVGPILVRCKELIFNKHVRQYRNNKRDTARARAVLTELYGESSDALRHLDEAQQSHLLKKKFGPGHSGNFDVLMLYSLVRTERPRVVLETGVASGRSSSFILLALETNGEGELYSVDLPKYFQTPTPGSHSNVDGHSELDGFVPNGNKPGWLVPDELRHRWHLVLGDSKKKLREVLKEIPKVDIFYHDSDHSYDYMMFEFELAWPQVPNGGYFLSDDIRWNTSWDDFLEDKNTDTKYEYRNFGIVRKNDSE